MDTLVLDIETKNTFAEVGGKYFIEKLNISVVCVYSYKRNEYLNFEEKDFPELKKLLSEKAVIVGFSSNKFDVPILNRTLGLDMFSYPRIDLSDEIEQRTGRLISLDNLAKVNLGNGKTHSNLLAPELYRAGKIEELKMYCQNDVKITKEIYDKAKREGFLLIPEKDSNENVKVNIEFSSDVSLLF